MKDRKHDMSSLYSCTVLGLMALIVFIIFPHTISKISAEELSAQVVPPVVSPETFDTISLTGKAAFVYDLSQNKILFEKNAETALPLASLTKIMTAITAVETAPASTVITIHKEDLAQDGDSGLLLNEKWTLENLLRFSLVVSSNDGAYAIADNLGSHDLNTSPEESVKAFVALMNAKSKFIGLSNTIFFDPTGLDESVSLAGAYGSAHDVATMLAFAVNHHADVFDPTRYPTVQATSIDGLNHTGENTDILTEKIPNLIAGKTGNSDLAGGNLAVMFEPIPSHRIIIVVLGSTYDGRFTDMQKIVNAITTEISQK